MSTAMVTGATAGIGAAFAGQLAAEGYDLVLVARDGQRLRATAATLEAEAGVRCEVLAADLADRDQLHAVEQRLAGADRPIDLLINNAGFALNASFLANDIDDEERMLDVLIRSVLRLTHAALRAMTARGHGKVINVSSVGGFIPRGTYNAHKAWVTSFSAGLAAQLTGSGVHVMAVCPGFVRTELHARAGIPTAGIPKGLWLRPEHVAATALADARRGRAVSVPSFRYKALVAATRLLPHRVSYRLFDFSRSR